MQLNGHIKKMTTSLENGVAQYKLTLGENTVKMNDLVGRKIGLTFNNEIRCSNCSKLTNNSYSQGFCFLCASSLAKCDLCIVRPETCHYHLGTCREEQWGRENCFQPHIIYLANSSGVKVGITKKTNIPQRWIDQGAIAAIPILEVKTRLESGIIEKFLNNYVSDRTNWRKMLKNETENIDLEKKKQELLPKTKEITKKIDVKNLTDDVINICYPVLEYPNKINSVNFNKTPHISGELKGIKGQYLLFEKDVVNIRKFSSYNITLSIL